MKKLKQTINKISLLIVLALVAISCDCPDCVPASYSNEPAKIISIKQAVSMYQEYDLVEEAIKGAKANDDGTDYNPTRYVEYSIEEMKHYLAYIESEAALANVDIETLRIYFGAYPDAPKFNSGEPARYRKQESIFIVPTALNEDGEPSGFFTTSAPDSDKRIPVYFKDLEVSQLQKLDGKRGGDGKKASEASFLPSLPTFIQTGGDRSLILNDGNVIPPPEQETDMDGKDGQD